MKAVTAHVVLPQRSDFFTDPNSGRLVASKRYEEILDYALNLMELVEEDRAEVSIASVADAGGGDITVTTATAHGLSVGDSVKQTECADSAYNGTFTVATVPDTTSYTVTVTYTATDTGKAAYTVILSAVTMVDVSGPIITNETVSDKTLSFTIQYAGVATARMTTSDGQTMEIGFDFVARDKNRLDAYGGTRSYG